MLGPKMFRQDGTDVHPSHRQKWFYIWKFKELNPTKK